MLTQGKVTMSATLTVTEKTPPPTGQCGCEDADRCGEQKINITVNGGPLTMSREAGEVDLTPVTLNGTEQTATGSLKRVEVIDARGGSTGWSLTGTLTDFGSAACHEDPGREPVLDAGLHRRARRQRRHARQHGTARHHHRGDAVQRARRHRADRRRDVHRGRLPTSRSRP